MEFSNELLFLSVIEEERENADGDSPEETEKWKTDYQHSESSLSNKIGIGDRKLKEKVASKIPVRQDKLQVASYQSRKEIRNEQITLFQEFAVDDSHANNSAVGYYKPDSTLPLQYTENDTGLQKSERSRVVELPTNQDESTTNGKHRGSSESLADNENSLKQSSPCSEGESDTPSLFLSLVETPGDEKSGLGLESNSEICERKISVSELKGANKSSFSVLKGKSSQHLSGEERLRAFENHKICERVEISNVCDKNYSSSDFENHPLHYSEVISEMDAETNALDVKLELADIFGNTTYLSAISNDHFSIPNALDLSRQNSDIKEIFFDNGEKIPHENSCSSSNHENCCLSEETNLKSLDENMIQKFEDRSVTRVDSIGDIGNLRETFDFYEPSMFSSTPKIEYDSKNSDMDCAMGLNNGYNMSEKDDLITAITGLFSNTQENVNVSSKTTGNCVINAEYVISDGYDKSETNVETDDLKSLPMQYVVSERNDDYGNSISNFINLKFEESCDNLCINSCSLEVTKYSLQCHEPDENILEAPAEFRTDCATDCFPDEKSMKFQVSPPQPPSVPEKESPIRDHHNTYTPETDDTIHRPTPTGENERRYEMIQENRRTQESDVSNLSSTDSVLPTFPNSTEDNGHVKLEGGNRIVSAFEHVGNYAPIQRHDMLQIDRSERGEIVDRIGVNSAVLDLRSSNYRSLRRSASFNDRFSGGVYDELSSKIDKGQHDMLVKLQERLGQALDLNLSSQIGNSSVSINNIPGANSTVVHENQCGAVIVSNFGLNLNQNNNLCQPKTTCDNIFSVVKSNSDIYDVERRTYSERNMEEITNLTLDLPLYDQFRVAGKQDSNNNLSDEKCISEKDIGHEKGESPAVIHRFADTSSPTTPASSTAEERNTRAPVDAHLSESRFPKLSSSIHGESGVPAPAPGCSPTKTAAPKGCVGSRHNSPSGYTSCSVGDHDHAEEDDVHDTANLSTLREIRQLEKLRWSFKNGRLVFDSDNIYVNNQNVLSRDLNSNEVNLDSIESTDSNIKLSSKDVNKRIDENKSRLRYLEEKLKRAGLSGDSHSTKKESSEFKSDVAKQVVDESESTLWEELKENENCGSISNTHEDEQDELQRNVHFREEYSEELRHFTGAEEFCQFDVSQVGSFSPVLNGYCLVYDELDEESDSEDEIHVISLQEDPNSKEEFYVISNNSKKLSDKMGTDSDRPKHNPDTENLRSLLKRPGKNKDKKSNRVVFNENKNEFFDADYIILIREECDYDDEDDDSVCTCNQHEMVRLTCCEPNCNCSVYDGFDPTPQSPKFAPPLEFVDAVTLSPPEGYKDMELGEQQLLALQQMARRGQQRRAVCRECSATHTEDDDDDGEGSQSDEGGGHQSDAEDPGEREKTDQSQQTTPTTPDNFADDSSSHDFTVDHTPMTVFEKTHSSDDESGEHRTDSSTWSNVPGGSSPISGILKGGKLWKQSSTDGGPPGSVPNKSQEVQQNTDSSLTSDEEGYPRRFVRFIESEVKDQRGGCDGASDDHTEEESSKDQNAKNEQQNRGARNTAASHDSTEMMLTFKLGNHVLISNNSLKPNSAVRQLFPCTKPSVGKDEESIQQYLVTAESLRAFEEAKRSKLPQIIQNGETDESIKKAIERNTLRRSLIRYEPRSKKNQPKTDNSLVERIKQLTCDVDDDLIKQEEEEIQVRASPPGEEARNSPEIAAIKQQDKSFSPSSSSTASSNSSSVSSTYKKITDLFNKKTDKLLDGQNNLVNNIVQETKMTPTLPDLGNGPHEMEHVHLPVSRINSCTNESRKQFLASLAPLTACVSGVGSTEDYFYQMNNHHDHGGQRTSVASSVGTEYSLEDIDEALRNEQEDTKRITPDVLAGTPSASESGDELAMFVQQDAGRIERIKKKYQPEPNKDDDDEHDDYGFNKRPSVRGIKPRFGTTTQIIQQIQNQMQPPDPAGRVSWPYYSESGLSNIDNSKTRNSNQNVSYQYVPAAPDDFKSRGYPNVYRPTSLTEEQMYQSGQFCTQMYRMGGNSNNYPAVVKLGTRCNDLYQSLPRQKTTARPLSPPPLEMSKTYHQTMVYIPYNHIGGCQNASSPNIYFQQSDYARVSNQNQINKRFIEPIYQQRPQMQSEDHHYSTNMSTTNLQKQMVRIPYPPQPHGMNCRSESPLPGQFSTARSTQTPVPNCNYYNNQRYRPIVGSAWQGDPAYISKINRHSFPISQRYTTSDTSTDTDSSQGIAPIQNGYRQSIEISLASQKDNLGNSPIKPKFTERGVPEGAASVSPPDTVKIAHSGSTITSPTSPQNVPMQTQKPLFYAMNV